MGQRDVVETMDHVLSCLNVREINIAECLKNRSFVVVFAGYICIVCEERIRGKDSWDSDVWFSRIIMVRMEMDLRSFICFEMR